MNSVLEEVEFLARSPYRFEVLRSLAEQPRDRRDLRESVGVSTPTAS
jgi:predicted transcriptional regulator